MSADSPPVGASKLPEVTLVFWLVKIAATTLGETAGDALSMSLDLGYLLSTAIFVAVFAVAVAAQIRARRFHIGGMAVFGGLLALIAAAYFRTRISRTLLFWAAFVLTRPLGAVLGDFLDKPFGQGGLDLSRFGASAALLGFIVLCLLVFHQRLAQRVH